MGSYVRVVHVLYVYVPNGTQNTEETLYGYPTVLHEVPEGAPDSPCLVNPPHKERHFVVLYSRVSFPDPRNLELEWGKRRGSKVPEWRAPNMM